MVPKIPYSTTTLANQANFFITGLCRPLRVSHGRVSYDKRAILSYYIGYTLATLNCNSGYIPYGYRTEAYCLIERVWGPT